MWVLGHSRDIFCRAVWSLSKRIRDVEVVVAVQKTTTRNVVATGLLQLLITSREVALGMFWQQSATYLELCHADSDLKYAAALRRVCEGDSLGPAQGKTVQMEEAVRSGADE